MFNKILVCSDGSEDALAAARLGAIVAGHFGSGVVVVNAFDHSFVTAGDVGVWAIPLDQTTLDLCMKRDREAAELAAKAAFSGVGAPYKIVQELGHPVDAILNVATREHVDLIVIGSRGLTGIKEFFLGSVSMGVLNHAHCAVLIAGHEHIPPESQGFQRIILVSDASEGAGKAAGVAVGIADKFASSLTVLNVLEPYSSVPVIEGQDSPLPVNVDSEAVAERIMDVIMRLVRDIAKQSGVYCDFHQEKGQAEETIVSFSEHHRADLIVMGSRGLGGFGRMLLGSVSNYVAHHASCPILVVR